MSDKEINPVQLFIGILYNQSEQLEVLKSQLLQLFGPIEMISPIYSFDVTDYYQEEMGKNLKRQFVSFRNLMPPESLPQIKMQTSILETEWSQAGKRKINLDPGYLDFKRVILASFKEGTYKIYLGKKTWADLVLIYTKGMFQPSPWSFADFKSGNYSDYFLEVRQNYKKTLAAQNKRNDN